MSGGIPEGSVGFVLEVLRASSKPVKRRPLLEDLERRGHRISLAGLNRILQVCREQGLTTEGPEGVRAREGAPKG
ncbi:MAG: hypothetical protein KGI89_16530 [Euryarchaeota archaeon]|nr:hypothetical protein [Euryarchaeota archaeon]